MRGHTQWTVWLRRRAGLDSNPLRRASDRAEAWIRLSLAVIFLIAAPLAAISVGNWSRASAASAARAQAAAEYQVRAVLLSGTRPATADPATDSLRPARARARWTAPDGRVRTGEVPVAAGTRAGSAVTVWTDAAGALTDPPAAQAQILGRVVSFVVVSLAALAVLLLTGLWITRRMLDHRRLASWQAEWTAVEPQWTRRRG